MKSFRKPTKVPDIEETYCWTSCLCSPPCSRSRSPGCGDGRCPTFHSSPPFCNEETSPIQWTQPATAITAWSRGRPGQNHGKVTHNFTPPSRCWMLTMPQKSKELWLHIVVETCKGCDFAASSGQCSLEFLRLSHQRNMFFIANSLVVEVHVPPRIRHKQNGDSILKAFEAL